MIDDGSLFGGLPIPKRRRTALKTVPNRAWQYDSQPEESSILSDEAEVAQALQNLASAGPFASARTEPEEGNSGPFEEETYEPEYRRKRLRKGNAQQRSRSRVEVILDESRDGAQTFRGGQQGATDSVLAPQADRQHQDANGSAFGLGQFSSVLPGAAYPGVLPGNGSFTAGVPLLHSGLIKAEPANSSRETFGSKDFRIKPTFKRCASHVYIARFIELQSNKHRLQQRQANRFGAQHRSDAEPPSRATAPTAVNSRHNITQEDGSGLLTSQTQELPSASVAHSFLGSHHFAASAGPQVHSAALQDMNPAYSQLLGQQQGGFPFLPPPGLHMGAFTPQQQMAAAQALAGFTGIFPPPHLMFPGALSSLGASTSIANGSAPVPSLPLPTAKPDGKMPHHTNGAALKQEDSFAELLKLGVGLAPGVAQSVDLERLRAMLPAGLFEQRALNQGQLLEGLKASRADQPSLEAWGAGMPTRL